MIDLPISVVVVTLNAGKKLAQCLDSLALFDDVWVVDSCSADNTRSVCGNYSNVRYEPFVWDGRYPKKRQWCLDNLELKYDWVFFVDADELVPSVCMAELVSLFRGDLSLYAGFFVQGRFQIDGRILRFGVSNSKLALIHRKRITFPVIDDLDVDGMGEIEGHYQPILIDDKSNYKMGRLKNAIIHDAIDCWGDWREKHERYAAWSRGVNARNILPDDPRMCVRLCKKVFLFIPLKRVFYFGYAYALRLGFLDGKYGFILAKEKALYYESMRK